MAAKVTRLRTRRHGLCAAEAFLDTIGSPNTRRAYAIAIVKTVDALDEPGPIGRSRALELPARRGRQWLHWCARAEELLQLNIEDLDQTGRRAPVKSKGAEPRTRRRPPQPTADAELRLFHIRCFFGDCYWDPKSCRCSAGRPAAGAALEELSPGSVGRGRWRGRDGRLRPGVAPSRHVRRRTCSR